ncbi:Oidioi.mRNA.OKI2018_I69.PAR.g12370.t1.cds [Oikopleura dioica]|uniref:Oidioi.mRNA.OKI2018_I69.PAR.g12370.t1.cds n=1 Tax=Oikopleura dioica TaxID=34765 RepID=A0ABN7S4J9_OIKDI|nr:Oidioi.mRNA.OKI2018_I69.PAR.g12370.t1.cds [Oikopleura dioica]
MTEGFQMNTPATMGEDSCSSDECEQQRAPALRPCQMTRDEYIQKCEEIIGDGNKKFEPYMGYRLWKVAGGDNFFIPASTLAEIIKRKNLKVPRKLRDRIRSGENFDNFTIMINKRDYNYYGSTVNNDPHLMLLRRELRSTTQMREEEEKKAARRLLKSAENDSSGSDNETEKKAEDKK